MIEKPRPFVLLVDAVVAAFRGDGPRLTSALERAGPEVAADRHRCGAFLADAAIRLGINDTLPVPVRNALRQARLTGFLSADRIGPRIADIARRFQERGIPFALLKGAARIARREPLATCHASADVDVLVPQAEIDRAVQALLDAGYSYRCGPEVVRLHRRLHHHDAELYPADAEFPVEIHRTIIVAGKHSLAGDWEALAANMETISTRFGEIRVLGAVAAALHLAIHATGNVRLRDIVILAHGLRSLDEAGRLRLRNWVAQERLDPVRLRAALVFAAALQWSARREDLPAWLRDHAWFAEARRSRPGGLTAAMAWTVFGMERRLDRRFDPIFNPLRGPGRIALGAAAELRAAALAPQRVEDFRFVL